MPSPPPIFPADPGLTPSPAESPCEPPDHPARAAPEFAPPQPDTCVPDRGLPEDPVPDDARGATSPGDEAETRAIG